jgi:hypothetical protein
LESSHSMAGVCFFSCRHDSGCQGSGSEWRTCESRRRPQRPCWATVFMWQRSCFHGFGGNIVLLVRQGCWLGLRASGKAM